MSKQNWLGLLAAAAAILSCSESYAGTYKTITIDNSYADWVGVPVLDSDGGDNAGGPDIGDTQIANDDNFLYIRNTFPNNDAMQTYVALDIDSNTATGYDVFGAGLIGSEAAWQNDFAFRQSTGVFNSGSLSGDFFGGGHALLSPFADATTSRELAISLDALFAADNSPVFPDGSFSLLIWTDNGFDVSARIDYTLATPVPEPSTLALIALVAAGSVAIRRRRAITI
jgi:PEP-CTERM motif